MGTNGPNLADVRAAAHGLDNAAIEDVRATLSALYPSGKLSMGQNPWRKVRRDLEVKLELADKR
jgi:hypothetical protein